MRQFSRVVVRNSGIGMMAQLAIKVLSFGFSVLIVRNLGADAFGQYTAVLAFGAMFIFLADLGLSPYTVREVARHRDAPDGETRIAALFADVLALRFLLSLLAAGLLILTAWLSGRPMVMVVAIALGTLGLVMYSLQGTCDSLLAGYERLDLTAGTKVLYQLIFVIGGTIALLAGFGYYGLIGANLVGIALMTVACWQAVRFLRLWPSRPTPQRWGQLLRASIPFGIIGFTLGLSYKFDTVLLNIFRGDTETGYYNAAYNLVFSTVMLSNVINTSLFPSLTRQASADASALGPIYERAIRYLLILALPIAAGSWALAEQLVPFLFGADYTPAVPALQIVIWVVPLMFITEFLGYVVLVAGNERSVARSVIISTSVNVLLNALLVPRYGFVAAAAMTVVTETLLVSQYLWLLRNDLRGMRWQYALVRPLMATALMAAIVLLAKGSLPLLVTVAVGIISYAGLLLAFGAIGADERQFVQSLRRRQSTPLTNDV